MRLTRRDLLVSTAAAALVGTQSDLSWAQEQPKRGGTFSVHMPGEQRILNPAIRASTGVYIVTSKIMESLVDLDANGKPLPVLATSWEATPDGKTITFHLRDGVNWHDGKPFTSADEIGRAHV